MKPLDRILADGGKVCAYKARKDYVDDELKGLEGWSHRMVPLCVPSLEGERLMLVLERKEV